MRRFITNRLDTLLRILVVSIIGATAFSKPAMAKDPVVAGRALSYWIAQATGADRSEDLGQVVTALSSAVASEDPSVKVAASDALAFLGVSAKPALPVLLDQQSHELGWVRASAAAAIVAMGQEAVPAVQELFEKQIGAPSVRSAFILGAIGPAAQSAVPALLAIRAESPPLLQALYDGILNQINPDRFPGNTSSQPLAAGRVQLKSGDMTSAGSGRVPDWPQYHGPHRDSVCPEQGLLQAWPDGGPKRLWVLENLGKGYSSLAITGGRILTMGDRPLAGGETVQCVVAFDLHTRRELWAARVGAPFQDGPRCTPTVVGDRVYALGTEGDLVCLETDTGRECWRKHLVDDLGGTMMSGWKYSESPLVDGDHVICTPGGAEAGVVALDRHSGRMQWQCTVPALGDKGKDGAAYSSALLADIQGVRQVVQIVGRGVIGIEAATGQYLWGYNRIACKVANVTTPVVRGNYVFVTTAYNTGSALLEITRQGDRFAADELYFLKGRDFQNHHGGVVLTDGHLYGGSGNNSGHPTCIDLATGKICWSERPPARGSASVLYADGHVIFRYDRGEVVLIEATPEALRIKGQFMAVQGDGAAWAHPVIHQGRLYLRHGNLLACYDLRDVD